MNARPRCGAAQSSGVAVLETVMAQRGERITYAVPERDPHSIWWLIELYNKYGEIFDRLTGGAADHVIYTATAPQQLATQRSHQPSSLLRPSEETAKIIILDCERLECRRGISRPGAEFQLSNFQISVKPGTRGSPILSRLHKLESALGSISLGVGRQETIFHTLSHLIARVTRGYRRVWAPPWQQGAQECTHVPGLKASRHACESVIIHP
ncbi:hypothetical protein J6590_012316 [Homalodisca vitripennis]|nr:hypothetical protein J6590_012316 [Homalodisca vitripennis]